MKKSVACILFASLIASAGCSGLARVGYDRNDRGRTVSRIAVVAHNQSTADRYKMWAWTKRKPHIVPPDTFAAEIDLYLAARTSCAIVPQSQTDEIVAKLGAKDMPVLRKKELKALGDATGADAVLFADVTFYLQNYLFWKLFGVVEVSMRLVGTQDGELLWSAKGKNVGLLETTDSSLEKVRDKMLVQLAQKLERDKGMKW
jgi:hypothetical protein